MLTTTRPAPTAAEYALTRALMAGNDVSDVDAATFEAAFQAGMICKCGGKWFPSMLGESMCGNVNAFATPYCN